MNEVKLDRESIRACGRAFLHILQNFYRGAIYIGNNQIMGTTLFEKPLLIHHHDFQGLKLIYTPPRKEQLLVALLYNLIQPGMRCVDLGSGCGYYAVTLSHFVGKAGEVHSFESDQEFFPVLLRNKSLNKLDNLHCSSSVPQLDNYFCHTESQINFIHAAAHLDLCSMFEGMQRCISQSQPLYIMCHINPVDFTQKAELYSNFFKKLTKHGFEGYICPGLDFLTSDEQLTQDRSLKTLLLSRHTL